MARVERMGQSKRWQRIRSPAATEARETKPVNYATSNRGYRFTLSLGELSALTATIGGLTYLLGLFVFAFPIRRVYPIDFSAAWYATSLVPKTVVAGQGVAGMLGWPLVLGVLGCVLGFVYLALEDLVRSNYQSVGTVWRTGEKKVGLVILSLLPVVGFFGLWFLLGNFPIAAIFLIASLLIVLISLRNVLRRHNLSLKFEMFARNARGVVFALTFVLLVQFAQQAVTVAQESDPPLPRVEITWITDASNSTKATLTEGKLLTHTESFWYVLNKGGQYAGLTAIPDDKVQNVRIGPPVKKHGE